MINNKLKISIVATIYNSEKIIPVLVERINAVFQNLDFNYEIILVNDNSPDNSWNVIKEICNNQKNVKGILLSRNFGQQIAMSSGMNYAKGDYVIIMDGDLQNPPEAIPEIILKLESGFDVVYTRSITRNNKTDEWTSKLFYFLLLKVLKVKIVPNQLMLKGFNKKFITLFNTYHENIRTIIGIVHDIGLKSCVLNVNNSSRYEGKSSYNFTKRFSLMVDLILSMSNKPIERVIFFSLMVFVISILISLWTLINYILYPNLPQGYSTIIISIFVFSSLILLVLGIIGKYISFILNEVRNRPLYIVQEIINEDKF